MINLKKLNQNGIILNKIDLEAHLSSFTVDSFTNNARAISYLKFFGDDLIHYYEEHSFKINLPEVNVVLYTVDNQHKVPYFVDLCDLARLHFICLYYRVTSILELGSGHSSVFFAHAMQVMELLFSDDVGQFNRIDPIFRAHSVDESKNFLGIARSRVPIQLSRYINFYDSGVLVREFEGRICTEYSKLPDVGFDLLYLDGPSQYASSESVGGITFNKPFRFPLAFDPLRLEYFMEPGTLILVDGRSTNVSFLQAFMKRNWVFHRNFDQDFTLITLKDPPLGKLNSLKLGFRGMLD